MLLEALRTEPGRIRATESAFALMQELYPICRSITGDGVRRTLDAVGKHVPLQRHEVPSGTPAFDWEVPREWNIRDAYVRDADGRRVIDFREHNLHVVNYSIPVRRSMTRAELEPHLHSLPDRPDWIPYRTTYYKENWGFCLRHRDRERLGPGPFEVVIDSQLENGHLSYAECAVPGSDAGEAIVYTHTCHPSLANDNLTGIAAATALAGALKSTKPRLTWRFIFGPGTIGSLTWLSRNEERLACIRHGLVVGLLGDAAALTYKRSRLGQTATDRAAELVLNEMPTDASRIVDFEPYGYDERQFCSPGFNLPVGRLTRSTNGSYAEYHSSADELAIVHPERFSESLAVLAQLIGTLDANRVPINLFPKGEPRLGKRGLYGNVGGNAPAAPEQAMLWVLSLADGTNDLIAMARRSGMPFETIERAASELERCGVVRSTFSPIPSQAGIES